MSNKRMNINKMKEKIKWKKMKKKEGIGQIMTTVIQFNSMITINEVYNIDDKVYRIQIQ